MKDHAPRDESPPLHLSVLELVGFACRSGDMHFGTGLSIKPADAIRMHGKIQKSRGPGYESEFSVSAVFTCLNRTIELSGRIDGLMRTGESILVEEIKTTTNELEWGGVTVNHQHWAQLRCYAALIVATTPEPLPAAITLQLTYCRMPKGVVCEHREDHSPAELTAFLNQALEVYVGWIIRIEAWRAERDCALAAMAFPFGNYRPGQRDLAAAVFRCVRDDHQLLAQAPTGIGKSAAILFGALKAMPAKKNERIFYCTARTTGRESANKAVQGFRHAGAQLKSVVIRAKKKACLGTPGECTGCRFALGYFDRINAALEQLFAQSRFDEQEVTALAREFSVCPFELSLELAHWADVIICDYNYVFDPRVRIHRFFDQPHAGTVVLIDEAHNLVERGRDMYSAILEESALRDLRTQLRGSIPSLNRALGPLLRWLGTIQLTEAIASGAPPTELLNHCRTWNEAVQRWLGHNPSSPLRPLLLERFFETLFFSTVGELFDQRYCTLFEGGAKTHAVTLCCLDPARNLSGTLECIGAAIFFSATLSPMGYFIRTLGCSRSIRTAVFDSPFDPTHFYVSVLSGISTIYRNRETSALAVVEALQAMIEARVRPGNYLIFFPSFEYLHLVYSIFLERTPHCKTIIQAPSSTEAERESFLAAFTEDSVATLVGFVVMGGVYGEGIDLVGERLNGVAVVGVGLPKISPRSEALRSYFDAQGRDGFGCAYQIPGMIKVLQAAGRVIRTEHDIGVTVLIDERFTREAYHSLFPRHWHASYLPDTPHLAHELAEFWQRKA